MDADLQVFPEDLPLFLNKMQEGYDLADGIRSNRKGSLILKACSKVFTLLLSNLLRIPIKDATRNYTAVRSKLVKDLDLLANDNRYIIPIIHHRGAVKNYGNKSAPR